MTFLKVLPHSPKASIATVEVAEDGFDDFGRRVKGKKVDRKAKEAAAL